MEQWVYSSYKSIASKRRQGSRVRNSGFLFSFFVGMSRRSRWRHKRLRNEGSRRRDEDAAPTAGGRRERREERKRKTDRRTWQEDVQQEDNLSGSLRK